MSDADSQIINNTKRLGIKVICTESCYDLPIQVQKHADMLILKINDEDFLLAKNQNHIKKELENMDLNAYFIDENLENLYPNDCLLNKVMINNYCIGKIDNIPLKLKLYCIENNIKLINIKQGYSKCSTAVLNSKAIITSDKNISLTYKRLGFDVLNIPYGDIELPGYEYGFIGGCCTLIDNNLMIFTGNLEKYKYGKEVKNFLNKYNIKPIYLRDDKLIDIGGFIIVN